MATLNGDRPIVRYVSHATAKDLKIISLISVVLIHSFAIGAIFFFSWPGFASFVILLFITGQAGINLGFHRLLSHRSFRTTRSIERGLALCGTLALQIGPISWVGNHRYHHRETDKPLDPHTPLAGFAWAHFFWTFFEHPVLFDFERRSRWARDLAADPFYRFLERRLVVLNVVVLAGLLVAGRLWGGWYLGVSLFLWGGCLRIVAIWHMTFIVNSVNHLWGYRTYDSPDNSRNNVLISLLVFGEGWHNNHHAEPRSAAHGHKRFEIDVAYMMIRTLEMLGLATDVIRPRCWRRDGPRLDSQ